MYFEPHQQSLALANELVAEGCLTFTFDELVNRLGKSKTATANLLKRMEKSGLVNRVRRGHYVVRQLGMLGLPTVNENIALSVGTAMHKVPHRIAYRTALYEHDLLVHPPRSIQVATTRRTRTKTLSGQPLQIVIEPPAKLEIGRVQWGPSYISDRHRAVLDAAQRPLLVGGIEVLAETFATAAHELNAEILMDYARRLGWAAALRRLGSLADALALEPIRGTLQPVKPITADLDLAPGTGNYMVWRDRRWRMRWPRSVEELLAVISH